MAYCSGPLLWMTLPHMGWDVTIRERTRQHSAQLQARASHESTPPWCPLRGAIPTGSPRAATAHRCQALPGLGGVEPERLLHDAFVGLAGAGKLGTTSASPSTTF